MRDLLGYTVVLMFGAAIYAVAVVLVLAIGGCALPKSTQYTTLPQTVPAGCADRLYDGEECLVLDMRAGPFSAASTGTVLSRALR